jgi:hypothetical protein
MNTKIIATGTGVSSSITLPDGVWNLFIESSNWGSTTIQVSNDTTWFTVTENDAALIITENTVKEINGGLSLRLNVSAYSSNIILTAKKVL